jgi:PAT family beta-lactamase induction signal transducer AmpG
VSGLPFLLTASTLSVWLKESGVSYTSIAFYIGLASTPYAFKFIWAPLLDHLTIPYLSERFGRRRGWLILSQVLQTSLIIALGQIDPCKHFHLIGITAFALSLAAATHLVVLLAYQIESIDKNKYGSAEAVGILGYRIGMLVAGAGALYLSTILPWSCVYLAMGGLSATGIIFTLLMNESQHHRQIISPGTSLQERLKITVANPFLDFMRKEGWLACLALMFLARLSDSVIGSMSNIFYLDLGFTKSEIASATKVFGMWATITGGFLAGAIIPRFGILRCLFYFTLFHGASNGMFFVLMKTGPSIPILYAAIALEHITSGMRTTALFAYQMLWCSIEFAATQISLLTSSVSFGHSVFSSYSGWIVDHLGWSGLFGISILATLPILGLISVLRRCPDPSAQRPVRTSL